MLSDNLEEKNSKAAVKKQGGPIHIIFTVIVLLAIVVNLTNTVMIFQKGKYLDYVLGRVSKEEYLQQRLEYYAIYSYINNNLPEDAYLFLVLTGNQGYYLERRFFSDAVFEAETMKKILSEAETSEEILMKFKERQWTHLLIRRDFFISEFRAKVLPEEEKILQEFFDNHLKTLKKSGAFWLFKIV